MCKMLKITEIKCINRPPSAAQRTSRRLRKAYQRRQRSKEYLRLKNIIPTVANKKKVDKIEVVEEAIRYIDHLHEVLSKKLQQVGCMPQTPEQAAILNMVKMMAASGNIAPIAMSQNFPFSIPTCSSTYCSKLRESRQNS